jgi:uncharacterized membrane protein YoaK (UPF0700 family)
VNGPTGETDEADLALAVTLTALAGFVDGVAFVHFGGVFVSFMSGNSTRFAALPSEGRLWEAASALGLVVLFVMGAFAGRLLGAPAADRRRPALMAVVAGLLILAALWEGFGVGAARAPLAGAAMAMAMGVQNSVLHRAGQARATPTYVTGTLVSLGHALADAFTGQSAPWLSYLLMWLGLVAGAAVGAVAAGRHGLIVLLAPAAVAALLAVGLGALVRRPSAPETRS